MAARKKTTPARGAKNGKTTRARAAAPPQRIDRRWSILLFGLGVLFVVLSFIKGEAVWLWMRTNILFGVFGICGWVLGPFLIYLGVLVTRQQPFAATLFKGLFFMASVCGFVLVFSKLEFGEETFTTVSKKLFESGKESAFGPGFLSIVFGYTLMEFCGRAVARILLVLFVLGAIVLLVGPERVAAFFRDVAGRVPQRPRPDETYEDEYDDEGEQEDAFEREMPPPQHDASVYDAMAKPRRKKGIDIPLDSEVKHDPGLARQEEVVIAPGGTFGKKALEDLGVEPPTVLAEGYGAPQAGEDLPFVPAVAPPSSMARPKVFDYEEEQRGAENAAEADLFGREDAPPPVQVFEEEVYKGDALDESGILQDPEVDQMIAKAAASKPDKKAQDTREEGSLFSQKYEFPPATLFDAALVDDNSGAREEMRRTADLLVSTLQSFGVETRILDVSRGPSVTRYEVQPQAGVKISRITNLADDIALNLAAAGVRIEAPIPGKPAVGIEVPNKKKTAVSIRGILENSAFADSDSALSIALGKDIAGDCVVTDLTRMPHLLIAGSTGSGKSVCVNATIMSFLYKSSPDDVRLVLIDPKVVELAEYNGLPHLLMPVVTEPRKAAGALGAMVAEMEKRYRLFAENNVRDIKTFNKLAARRQDMEKLPYIAIVIDELADLMMTSGKEVEDYICRIAQKARAAGMHLIVATQRPSVDVITGLIKANIPSRIAFAVSSQVDSRTILDGAGAEKLLGMGDMLFMPVGANKPLRVQGTYVKDKEISRVLQFIKANGGAQYDDAMIEEMEKRAMSDTAAGVEGDDSILSDETFVSAVEMALDAGQISTSNIQRRLRLGYARAGRIVDQMEQYGIVGGPNGSKPRELLINRQQWQEMVMNAGR